MYLCLMEIKIIYTIFHILGAVLGAGGAYVSDAMFFSSVRDRVIGAVELRFLRLGSIFVWMGLGVLIVSGALLFSTNPAGYLASSKFVFKMFVVLVILINGIVFHTVHLPRIHRHAGHHYPSSDEFMRKRGILVASGVVSMTSWTVALVLGVLRSIPVDLGTGILVYIIFEIVMISGALLFSKRLI